MVPRHKIRELGKVGLPQDDGSGFPQPADQERVFLRDQIGERVRPGRGMQAFDIDIVFDEHRNAVQRASVLSAPALFIRPAGVKPRVRIDLGNGVQAASRPVVCRDRPHGGLDKRCRSRFSVDQSLGNLL